MNSFFLEKRFSFPKSLYATSDAIHYIVAKKPNALIIDFFAGSGTTLHAVNLLNAEDGGHRRCIMVPLIQVVKDVHAVLAAVEILVHIPEKKVVLPFAGVVDDQVCHNKGVTQRIFDGYWQYHQEAIQNAYLDIDSLVATGQHA